ncbi:PqqD family protein [Micromonospora echinofusca]|uniref:Coenzyme PQQ synthesis protein D (PqqD) n=1 Tax=Micromonospora echinofusca TaxID=47858 RepID=A0A1C5GGN2_MICEH|nr:PqqD family protein [Micromonospora echinofusca]SCG18981.1 Coenzyme PQQ synthesis protein D (PqqD) [Micromonospora echinofusca]
MSLHISDAVIWNEMGDGVSLYHVETGEFRSLNDTAAKIWVLLSDDGDPEAVKTKLSLLYGAGNAAIGARIRADVDAFLDTMVERGMLVETVQA